MRNAAILSLILLAMACKDRAPPVDLPSSEAASAAPVPAAPATSAASASPVEPAELARLAKRIEACQHFAGEEPYDATRAAELRREVEANCPGNDDELARLRGKYAGDARTIRRLDALQAQQE